jgi:translation initiation factor IF-3
LGVMSSRDAYQAALDRHLDLVEIAPAGRPPVCKIMDYGKYRYEQQKRDKEARKKQRVFDIKEVKLRPGIEDHDFDVKLKNAIRFLEDGDKVKATIMFRGRELSHPELGEELLKKLEARLVELAVIEKRPKLEGKNMIMIIAPKQK